MEDKEIEKKKKELMEPGWTEDLHHALEELPFHMAKKIVESMTDIEIHRKVNNREMQEDYIAEYLEYLWTISKSAYWKQLSFTINVNIGILWGGDMPHFWKLCNYNIPYEVFDTVLNFAAADESQIVQQDFDAIGCVVRAQVKRFGKLKEVKNFISTLSEDKRDDVEKRIFEMINSECTYSFF